MFPRVSGTLDHTFHASSSTSDIEAAHHPDVEMPTGEAHAVAASTPNTPGRAQPERPRGIAASLKGLLIKQQTPEQRAEVRAWSAARSGKHEKLQALLAEHPDLVFRTDRHGQNLLSVAARAGQRSTAITVLSHAAMHAGGVARVVNQRNAQGETPLFLASSRGHAEVVSALLSAPECDVNAEDKRFRTPLHKAVKEGHADVVALLLADARIASGLPDADDNTPLHLAVSSRPELVKTLAAHPSAVPNAVDKQGLTALERAIETGRRGVVADLLSVARVDASSPGKDGLTPFWRALRQFKHDIEGSLGSTKDSRQMLQTLANSPRVDMSRMAPGEMEDIGGHTPLTLLCSLAYYNPLVQEQNERFQRQIAGVMETMLAGSLRAGDGRNLDPNAKDWRGRTPLQWALTQGKETERTLLMNDPRTDPNVRNGIGQTLLEIAAVHDRPDWAHILLSNVRTNPNLPMSTGSAPLAWAMHVNRRDWAELLLGDRRTDPNVADILPGRTLLLGAVERGKLDWARMLYHDRRTDPNALATLLTLDPQTVHIIVERFRPVPRGGTPQAELRAFKEATLARWADMRRADGTRWPKSTITNMRLGEVLAERERQGASSSSDCRPGAVFRFGLALELALQHNELIHAKEAAGLLLRHAPRDQQFFNLHGVDVSRTEIESWAAGRFSEGIINRTIDGQIQAPQNQNVHLDGLNARGAYILSVAQAVIRESAKLTAEDRLDATNDVLAERVRASSGTAASTPAQSRIEDKHLIGLDETLAGIKAAAARAGDIGARATEGMNWALQIGQARELTDMSPQQALRIMWTYIDRRGEQYRDNLTHALLNGLADIPRPNNMGVCAEGCLQRILYSADGIDDLLTPKEPGRETIHAEIAALAGKVTNRFEALYGDSLLDLADEHAVQSTPGEPLSSDERALIAHYQRTGPIDDAAVLRIKQDMLAAEVAADLVGRRGWSPQAVEPELARVKEAMSYL
jgi:ankyrin repeat protein